MTPAISSLPIELDVGIPVPRFRLRDLVNLEAGVIVETQWPHHQDLPLAAGDVQLGWSEFDVNDTKLTVRLTRFA